MSQVAVEMTKRIRVFRYGRQDTASPTSDPVSYIISSNRAQYMPPSDDVLSTQELRESVLSASDGDEDLGQLS